MKTLLINGSPHKDGCTFTALSEIAGVLTKHGVETEILQIGPKAVPDCIACDYCESHDHCVFNDQVNEVIERLDTIDALIVGSPTYYAGPSGQVTSFLDRLFYTAGHRMAGKPAAAIVSCRRGGASAAFDRLNKYFAISNMVIVTSQYWNQVHGNTPDEVRRDLEGMQTMRTLGENMAWLLRCLAVAKEHGVAPPVYEKATHTNFIRA